MTTAICFKCGAMKFAAFTPCQTCGVTPSSDDDLVLSIAMTDHYHFVLNWNNSGSASKTEKPLSCPMACDRN